MSLFLVMCAVVGASEIKAAPVLDVALPSRVGKARLAVMDVEVRGAELDPVVGESLSSVLAAEIALRYGERYVVLSRGDVRSLVRQQIEAQQTGCNDPSCARDLSGLAEADFTVTSSVGKLGDGWVLTLELTDVERSAVVARQKVTWNGVPAGLVELVRPYVARLLDGASAEAYQGTLEILSNEKNAQVVLNDAQLGVLPLVPVEKLGIGKHRVRVHKDGFLPYDADVVVHRNETTVLFASLVDESSLTPWYQKWWVWAATGAGAAAIVTTAILLTRDGPEDRELVIGQPLP